MRGGFIGGSGESTEIPIAENPPGNAGDTGSIPDPEVSHVPRSN